METINERIYQVRKALSLSMEKFGAEIGITRGSVNLIEKGVNNPSNQTIELICIKYKVNYFWLTEGKGEMFEGIPDTILDQLAQEYNLSEMAIKIIKNYALLPEDKKRAFEDILKEIIEGTI